MALSILRSLVILFGVFTGITHSQVTYFKIRTLQDGYYYCLAEGRERYLHCSTACKLNFEGVEFRFKGYSLGSGEHNLFWAQTANPNICLSTKKDATSLSYKSPNNNDWYKIQRDAQLGDGHDVDDNQKNLKGDKN